MVYFLTYYYNATGCIPPPLRKRMNKHRRERVQKMEKNEVEAFHYFLRQDTWQRVHLTMWNMKQTGGTASYYVSHSDDTRMVCWLLRDLVIANCYKVCQTVIHDPQDVVIYSKRVHRLLRNYLNYSFTHAKPWKVSSSVRCKVGAFRKCNCRRRIISQMFSWLGRNISYLTAGIVRSYLECRCHRTAWYGFVTVQNFTFRWQEEKRMS
jgi:hypothetical protein